MEDEFAKVEIRDCSKWELFESVFHIAGIPVLNHWELVNGYWPRVYVLDILCNPWWLCQTPIGLIRIGWRKRVMEIDWSATDIRAIVTEDNVTKRETMVHAWNETKAAEYLRALKACGLVEDAT